jgi:hypothetical protein
VEAAIWHLLRGRRKKIDQMAQVVTIEMSFDRKIHLFASLYKLRYPAEATEPELRQLIKDLSIAQEQRNALMHSAWSYAETGRALHRMKGSARADRGLIRKFYVVTPALLEDVRFHIASVGARFGQFMIERVQTHKRGKSPKRAVVVRQESARSTRGDSP